MSATAQLAQRLPNCEVELDVHRGYLKAVEYGVRAAIISHPAPAALAAVWRGILPSIADAHFNETALFSASLQQALSLLTEQVEEAVNPR